MEARRRRGAGRERDRCEAKREVCIVDSKAAESCIRAFFKC